MSSAPHTNEPDGKREETRLYIFLILFLFPMLSVVLVAGYGFIVWILQMIFGPPGPIH